MPVKPPPAEAGGFWSYAIWGDPGRGSGQNRNTATATTQVQRPAGSPSAAAAIEVLSIIRLLCSYTLLRSFQAASGSKSIPRVDANIVAARSSAYSALRAPVIPKP